MIKGNIKEIRLKDGSKVPEFQYKSLSSKEIEIPQFSFSYEPGDMFVVCYKDGQKYAMYNIDIVEAMFYA